MPEYDLSVLFYLMAAGFVAAFFDAVIGGGGAIAVPALLAAGMPPEFALGTNKMAGSMGTFTSGLTFLMHGKVNRRLVSALFPLSILGSALGVIALQSVPAGLLRPLMAVLLIMITVYTLVHKEWGSRSTFQGITGKAAVSMILAALGISFYDGFFGPGTGSFLIFTFLLLGFNFVESAANAKVLNFGSNLAALVMFAHFGTIHYFYGVIMGGGMVFGAAAGARTAILRGNAYVKLLYVLMSCVLIGRMIWGSLSAYV